MRISIADRLRPFSHQPGNTCLLPFSSLAFEIFPALIRVADLIHAKPQLIAEFPLAVQGPVEDFTMIQDLENGWLKVFGHSRSGYFCYRIISVDAPQKYAIVIEKDIPEGLASSLGRYCKKEVFFHAKSDLAKLSCGIAKGQNWQAIDTRQSLREILPFWFALGQCVPQVAEHSEGAAVLLNETEEALRQKNGILLQELLIKLYQVGFKSQLVPQLTDDKHLGIALPSIKQAEASPLWLLQQGANLIKSMLLQIKEDNVFVLPCLLPKLNCGRLINVPLGHFGSIAMEWSKKMIRRMIFTPSVNCDMTFHFQRHIEMFRLRTLQQPCCHEHKSGERLFFQAGESYLFDRFQR